MPRSSQSLPLREDYAKLLPDCRGKDDLLRTAALDEDCTTWRTCNLDIRPNVVSFVQMTQPQSWAILIPVIVALLSIGWGAMQYWLGETNRRHQLAAQRELDTRRPFLDRQLAIYTEAVRSAATIASSLDSVAVQEATRQFMRLYWGEMALVEDKKVEEAMYAFSRGLECRADRQILEQLSLRLAHAVRGSLAKSWGTSVWKSHYKNLEPLKDPCRTGA